MIEVEIRSIVKDAVALESLLRKKCVFAKEKHQVDEYFLHPCRDFYANPEMFEYLRIRSDPKVSFEYMKCHRKNGIKTHTEEFETDIKDPVILKEILLYLGFKSLAVVEKNRKYFDFKDFEFCLDSIKGLGFFLEVEAKKDLGGIDKTKQACIDVLKELCIEFIPTPEKGYPDMVIENARKRT